MSDAPQPSASSRTGRTFDDDVVEEKRPNVLVEDAPVKLSSLPDIVLVRFTASVSPYAAGEIAGVSKDYAIAALRKGWVDLYDGGKGRGHPVPRKKSEDDSRNMHREAQQQRRSGGDDGNPLDRESAKRELFAKLDGFTKEIEGHVDSLKTELRDSHEANRALNDRLGSLEEAFARLSKETKEAQKEAQRLAALPAPPAPKGDDDKKTEDDKKKSGR